MYIQQEDQLNLKFYTDVINSAVFGTPVSYLQKYPAIQDYQLIVQSEESVLKLIKTILTQDADKLAKIKSVIAESQIDQRLHSVLSSIIVNKIADIKREFVRKQISRGSPSLIDNNWKVVNILSTSSSAKTNKVMLNLMLMIETGGKVQTISLEMNTYEAQSFLNRLKELKKDMKS